MNKHFLNFGLILFFLAGCAISSRSQITVGIETMPDVDDVLEYSIFTEFEQTLSYDEVGGDLQWQFSDFITIGLEDESYEDITGHALADEFPAANMLVEFAGNIPAAAIRSDEQIEMIGIYFAPLVQLGIDPIASITPAVIFERRPVQYQDFHEDEAGMIIELPASAVPFLDSVEIPGGFNVDSIRISYFFYRESHTDAWGTVDMGGGGSFDVLKTAITDSATYVLEAKVSLGPLAFWLDVSELIDIGGFIPTFATTRHRFQSSSSKESIIEIVESRQTDSTGQTMTVVTGRMRSDLSSIRQAQRPVFLPSYPNPATDRIRLSGLDMVDENQPVFIYDVSGRCIRHDRLDQDGSLSVRGLTSGVYLLQIGDHLSKVKVE